MALDTETGEEATMSEQIWLSKETADKIEQLLALSKDKRWRKGFLQALVSFEIISQWHWEQLTSQITNPKPSVLLSAFDDPEALKKLQRVTRNILKSSPTP